MYRVFCFKQKTAYEMRISDWSSDVCSSDLETAQVFFERDGQRFFRTGDLGYYDEEGYFFIVDRLKRMINASGYKVWPTEIEGMMYAHPGLREVCIIATPDAQRGETAKAGIVPKPAAKDMPSKSIQSW